MKYIICVKIGENEFKYWDGTMYGKDDGIYANLTSHLNKAGKFKNTQMVMKYVSLLKQKCVNVEETMLKKILEEEDK